MTPVRSPSRRLAAGAIVVASLGAAATSAQAPPALEPAAERPGRVQRAELRLAAERSSYAPGTTARLVAVADVEPGWHLQAHRPTYDYLIPTVLQIEAPAGWGAAEVEYPVPVRYRFEFAEEELDVYEGRVRMFVTQPVPADAPAGDVTVRATLRYQACDDKQCLPPVERTAELVLTIGAEGALANPELFAPESTGDREAGAGLPRAGRSLATFLLLGVLGGLILNAMPCVLPILSLKLFGLVKAAGQGRRAVVAGALATSAGILASFWALAAAAVAARSAGAAVGWGIQFQRPGFVAFLALVLLLFALNLWGLFEIPLPARIARAAGEGGEGSKREGFAGHFVSGLFATLMATPCSAPFLGTAVGFALAQEAVAVVAVFTAIGVGMALPYLLLAAAPGAARWLPRPGAWMETVRGVMGFLLAGALVWLLYVLGNQIAPERLALVEGALLATGLLVWLAHRRPYASAGRRAWALAALLAGAGAVALAVESPPAGPRAAEMAAGGERIAWRPWDPVEAERLAAAGTPVFLDVTADWCVTCKVNERLILETEEIRAAFARHRVVAMKADWTNRDDRIGAFLAAHGRYGIPFYMLYRPGAEPLVYPELLTRDLVVRGLDGLADLGRPPAEPRDAPAVSPPPPAR